MKKVFILLFTASIIFLLTACGNEEEVADELMDYYNTEWIPVQVMKQEKMKEAEDKLKEKYDDVPAYRDELMEKYDLEFDKEKVQGDGYYEIQRNDG